MSFTQHLLGDDVSITRNLHSVKGLFKKENKLTQTYSFFRFCFLILFNNSNNNNECRAHVCTPLERPNMLILLLKRCLVLQSLRQRMPVGAGDTARAICYETVFAGHDCPATAGGESLCGTLRLFLRSPRPIPGSLNFHKH